jgi:integrase
MPKVIVAMLSAHLERAGGLQPFPVAGRASLAGRAGGITCPRRHGAAVPTGAQAGHREELTLRLHVLPAIGELRIERVGPRDMQRLVNSWRTDHAPRTVKRNYEVVRALFGYAVRNDWLARNPVSQRQPAAGRGHSSLRPAPEDVAGIAAHVSEEYRPTIWIGAALGLRWSEVAALRVGRLDLDAGRLAVAEALVRGTGGRNVFGPPKSKAGQRSERAR